LQEVLTPSTGSDSGRTTRLVADGLADQIMAMAARDAPGVWLARRVRVTAGPAAKSLPATPPVTKSPVTPPVTTPPRSFWNVVNVPADKSGQLKVTMIPPLATQHVGDEVNFRIESQRPGSLVVLEVGTTGRVRVWSPETLPLIAPASAPPSAPAAEQPKSLDTSALSIRPGQPHILPAPENGEEYRFRFDGAGQGQVRALVFDDAQDAIRLLHTFPGWSKDGAFVAEEGIGPQEQAAWIAQLKKLPYAAHPFLAADVLLNVQPRSGDGDRATATADKGLIEKAEKPAPSKTATP
jgi:hypothetical protein